MHKKEIIFDKLISCFLFLFVTFYYLNNVQIIQRVKIFYVIFVINIYLLLLYLLVIKKGNLSHSSYWADALLFASLGIVSSLQSFFVLKSLDGLIHCLYQSIVLFSIILLFILLTQVLSPYKKLINALFYGGTVFLLVGLYKIIPTLFGYKETGILYRIELFFTDPNYLACGIFAILFVSLIKVLNSEGFVITAIATFNIICSILFIFLTFSRTGILILLVFIFIVMVSYKKLPKKLNKLTFFVILVVVLLLLQIRLPILHTLLGRFFNPGEAEIGAVVLRMEAFKAGLNFISQRPLAIFLGAGVGATDLKEWFSQFFTLAHHVRIHDSYFSVIVEQGLLGFFIYFIVLFSTFLWIIKGFKKSYEYYLLFALFVSQIISAFSLWNIYFTPYWVTILYLPRLKIIEDAEV